MSLGAATDTSALQRVQMPIAFKMAALITAILIIGMGILATVVIGNQQRLLGSHIEEFGQLLNYQLALTATEPLFTDQHYELEALVKRYVESPRVLGAAIYDHDGHVIAASGVYPEYALLPRPGVALDLKTGQLKDAPAPYPKTERRAIVVAEPVTFRGTVAGHAVLALSRQALDNAQRQIIRVSLLAAAALSVVICLVAIYLGRRLARPLHTLVDATRLLERGEFIQIPERRDDEFGLLVKAINVMGQGLVRKTQVENIMRQVLDRDVANKLLAEIEPVKVGGDRVQATVLFADIVGFTTLSEQMSPEAVSRFLNEYFHYLDVCARFYFGAVDKFIGDAVMVVFGAPRADVEHHYHAVACAVLMQRLIARINVERDKEGLAPVQVRIGINSGDMLAGLVGSQQRMEYTVVGDAVNLASRLCNEAEGAQIIIEENLYRKLARQHNLSVALPRQIKVRGKNDPVTIYAVTDIDHSHPMVVEQMIDDVLHYRETQ